MEKPSKLDPIKEASRTLQDAKFRVADAVSTYQDELRDLRSRTSPGTPEGDALSDILDTLWGWRDASEGFLRACNEYRGDA